MAGLFNLSTTQVREPTSDSRVQGSLIRGLPPTHSDLTAILSGTAANLIDKLSSPESRGTATNLNGIVVNAVPDSGGSLMLPGVGMAGLIFWRGLSGTALGIAFTVKS